MNKIEQLARLINALAALGFNEQEIKRLRRIASTLHRWAEAECNGEIQRDEDNGNKPYRVFFRGSSSEYARYPVADREAGALKRLDAIMNAHPDLWAYHQGDPRGAALYIGKRADLKTDVNQVVEKARSWGALIEENENRFRFNTPTRISAFIHDDEEAAAIAYLKHRGASIPPRDLLPLDQYYTRGVAVY